MPGARAEPELRRRQILEAALKVATQQGLDRLTVRQVALEAGLSSGLVFFHFQNKDALLLGLLDDLLTWLVAGDPGAPAPHPPTTYPGLICSEVATSRGERERTEILLQFWVLGLRNPGIRRRIRSAMKRYQDLFLQAARHVLAGLPEVGAKVTPESLAGLSVALVLGSEIASLVEPKWFERWNPTAPVDALLACHTPEPTVRTAQRGGKASYARAEEGQG